jgi:hypothetical protein
MCTSLDFQKPNGFWQDDQRYLKVRFELLIGLLAQAHRATALQNHVALATLPASIFLQRGVALADDILSEHKLRLRILNKFHVDKLLATLMNTLNACHAAHDSLSILSVCERLLEVFDVFAALAGSSCEVSTLGKGSNSQAVHQTKTLILMADAHLNLTHTREAALHAERALAILPTADAFAIKFHCLLLGDDAFAQAINALTVTLCCVVFQNIAIC